MSLLDGDSAQGWLNTVFGALLAIGAWFVNRYINKVEALERQQSTCVTRDELKGFLVEIKLDQARMHDENIDNLREIRNDIKDLHKQ